MDAKSLPWALSTSDYYPPKPEKLSSYTKNDVFLQLAAEKKTLFLVQQEKFSAFLILWQL